MGVELDVALTERAPLTLGQQLKALREGRTHLSARALSLNAGLSESYVGKVEAGHCEPSFRALSKIIVELGLNKGEAWVLIVQEAHRT
jgi:predicted transcriptional regulator